MRISDWSSDVCSSDLTKLVKMVRQMALAFPSLDDAAASPPPPAPLKALLTSLKSDADLQEHLRNLVGFEKNTVVSDLVLATETADYSTLTGTDWTGGTTDAAIPADPEPYDGANNLIKGRAAGNSTVLRNAFEGIAAAFTRLVESALFRSAQQEEK